MRKRIIINPGPVFRPLSKYLFAILLIPVLLGCIPVDDIDLSANENAIVEPLDAHGKSTGEVENLPTKTEGANPEQHIAQIGAARGENAIKNTEIQIATLEGGGFHLTGSLDLDATLVYMDNVWVLEGSVTFPSTGFDVGVIYALPLKTIRFGPTKAQKITDDLDMAMLNIPIQWPDPTLETAPNKTPTPIAGRFSFAPELSFTATFITEIAPPIALEPLGS